MMGTSLFRLINADEESKCISYEFPYFSRGWGATGECEINGLPDGDNDILDVLSIHVFCFHGIYGDIHVLASSISWEFRLLSWYIWRHTCFGLFDFLGVPFLNT